MSSVVKPLFRAREREIMKEKSVRRVKNERELIFAITIRDMEMFES
jgi:hypothetical protein